MLDKKMKKEDLLKEKQYLILLIEKEMGEVLFPLMVDKLNKLPIDELTGLLDHLYEKQQEDEEKDCEIVDKCEHIEEVIELKDQVKDLKKQVKGLKKELKDIKKPVNKIPVMLPKPEIKKCNCEHCHKNNDNKKKDEKKKGGNLIKKSQRFLKKSDFFLKNEDKLNTSIHILKELKKVGYNNDAANKLAVAIIISTIDDK